MIWAGSLTKGADPVKKCPGWVNRRHRSKLSFTSCVPHFPMPTQSAKTLVSPCLACHVTIAYPHVGFTRNYSAAGFAQGCTLLWIRRSNLRLSERVCAVHYSVGVQSIDLGVR